MKTIDRLALYIVLFGVCIGIFLLIKSLSNDYALSKDYKVATGKILEFGIYSGRTSSAGVFTLEVNNQNYEGHFGSQVGCKNLNRVEKFEIKKFEIPVVYQPSNPSNCKMLFEYEDYEKFNVPYPSEELGRVLDKYFNCD